MIHSNILNVEFMNGASIDSFSTTYGYGASNLHWNLAPPPSNRLESVGVAGGFPMVADSVIVRVSFVLL